MRIGPGAARNLSGNDPRCSAALEARIHDQVGAAAARARLRHREGLARDGHRAVARGGAGVAGNGVVHGAVSGATAAGSDRDERGIADRRPAQPAPAVTVTLPVPPAAA